MEDGRIKDVEPLEVESIRCIGCERLAAEQKSAPEDRKYIWFWKRNREKP